MFTIKITHKGDKSATTYTVYMEEEARDAGVDFKYWRDAKLGDYGVSDDGYVAKVLSRKNYIDYADRTNTYIRFPWGYTFFSPKHKSKPLKVEGRQTNTTLSGKSYIKVQSKQSKMQSLAMIYAIKPNYDEAIKWALGEVNDSKRRKWKRTMKTETFKGMVRAELTKALQEHGLDEDFTLDLLQEAITLAKDKRDISNLLKAVENLQDMHGMKDKYLVKTVDKIEGTSTIRLIDELREEEQSFIAQRTTIKEDDGEDVQEAASE
jgi:hypothetical protein